ncbi:sigma-70 family RNA polymerase sigma factor [Roseiconus nitratireducens]|uniref:Sigma-70 family RNA polymerase sigma factor n=2 Tax=Roseiconus nitratireducens TaxID=2605748 RepID=A0A5M6DE60_9BACT|nr:sigma-70 family RNA polymerase sigma factor [Roseiconus nitratireducens]
MFLSGVRDLDPESWSRLVQTFGPIVYRWCRTSGVSPADAPDLVQDVFTSIARGIGGFQRQTAEGSFRSWIATITRNRIRDHFRRRAAREQAEGGTEALVRLQQQSDDIDDSVRGETIESPLLRQVMAAAQSEFEPKTWTAFCLTTLESKSPAAVAELTGLSVASVYQSKSRVLRRIRQRMAELPQ